MPAFMMNGVAAANSAVGKQVLMCPFSGPKNSPFDAATFNPTTLARENDPANLSTGALSTGIGFGLNTADGFVDAQPGMAVIPPNFTDDYTPGITLPSGVATTTAILTAIGGGKVVVSGAGNDVYTVTPYVAQPLLGFGGGGSRDAGAGPIFTGFGMKTVTASGTVAVGAAIEAGFLNRESFAMASGKSAFGSATAASPAVT